MVASSSREEGSCALSFAGEYAEREKAAADGASAKGWPADSNSAAESLSESMVMSMVVYINMVMYMKVCGKMINIMDKALLQWVVV